MPIQERRRWGREPLGQEKIDAAAQQPRNKADEEQALEAAVEKFVEEHKGEFYVNDPGKQDKAAWHELEKLLKRGRSQREEPG